MKLKFTVLERISFGILFPKEDNMITNRLSNDIESKINLTKEESEKIDLKSEKDNYLWDQKSAKQVNNNYEADFTEAEIRFLKERVNKLNDEKKIPRSFSIACEKIVDCKEEIPKEEKSDNGQEKKVPKKVT